MDLCEIKQAIVRRHPWEIARAVALQKIIENYDVKKHISTGAAILDIGCGDAFTIEKLCSHITDSHIDGIDIFLETEKKVELQQQRPQINFHNSYDTLPEISYDLVTMFDVLEHIEHDYDFLEDVVKGRTTSGSFVFVTVPAYNSLFGLHDSFLKHFRRYNHQELVKLMDVAGCVVIGSGYLFSSLLPVRFLTVCLEKLFKKTHAEQGIGGWHHGRIITSFVSNILIWDNELSLFLNRMGLRLPGLTVWALCKIP